ncbi:MarR family winged helix-turn-helix transcriptional regulator [Pseudoroseicyclus tamaricis]|uniref:MarR family transcriptional regulator n=1 Tax=Pseudoroseicyclus tamaricis TaxID=2705421 RepID=A0A6B2K0E0_9RHOB|nr:MarR family transcriptional regulator [Pseudoroseicyclus tamaricis]NDV01914.1 MarR family transcriptional regulator [Pseudoroseicyclus tamaricis]
MANPRPPDHADTLEVRDRCLCLHAQRAARALARRFDLAFRPLGLTNGQFSLLMALNRPEPPRMGDVANLLAMDRTTLTAALKPLERRGLLAVEPDDSDRRARRLRLTQEGRMLLGEALPIWREEHASLDAQVDAPGLVATLMAVTAAADRGED